MLSAPRYNAVVNCLMLGAAVAFTVGCGSSPSRPSGPPPAVSPPLKASISHLIVFASANVNEAAGLVGTSRVDPPLPEGLRIDPATGHLEGKPATFVAGALHWIKTAHGTAPLYVEVVARPRTQDRFVAPSGDDDADGSEHHPFRSLRRALSNVPAGTVIFLRGGHYSEDVSITGLHGQPGAPIVVRSYPGEHAVLEGARLSPQWRRDMEPGAAADEWISTAAFPPGADDNLANRGVMFGRSQYTRLLTYSQLGDLRSTNEKWALNSELPGPPGIQGPRRPWAYFGPGIWHDPATGLLHLRLSPTSNRVPGIEDYSGPTDPTNLELGVWYRASVPLRIERSSDLELHDLQIVGGGGRTVDVVGAQDVVFDHVEIDAATIGLAIASSTRVRFVGGRLDGGIPPWTFRSDFKDNYKFTAADGSIVPNDLIRKTSRTLLYVADGNREIEIAYSELVNAHDVYMAGIRSELHHCLIRNVHDDAMFISHTQDIDDLRIHHNVFQRVLTGLSAEGRRVTGPRYVYRNVFDLREPTASLRPGLGDEVWRWGWPFKGDFSPGPLYFYQNTLLLGRPADQAALMLFRGLERDGVAVQPRWFLNNIVAVDNSKVDRMLSWVPSSGYLAARLKDGAPVLRSDGNVWLRTGAPKSPMFRCLTLSSERCTTREWTNLDDLGHTGFDAHSRVATSSPFRQLDSLTSIAATDDLRPAPRGSAIGAGVRLPPELPDSEPVSTGAPDAGALSSSAEPLRVGVDGRVSYGGT